jgi:hypothetical protein
MKDLEIQERYVELRAQGWSHARIAVELNVHRNTLIPWSHKWQFRIQNLRAIELEALQETLLATRESRAAALAQELQKAQAELEKRNISELSTSRLITLVKSLRDQIRRETGDIQFSLPKTEIPKDQQCPQVYDWNP